MKANPIIACTTKKRYDTKEQAEDTAKYLFESKGVVLDTYKCQMCDGFHLTKGVYT